MEVIDINIDWFSHLDVQELFMVYIYIYIYVYIHMYNIYNGLSWFHIRMTPITFGS